MRTPDALVQPSGVLARLILTTYFAFVLPFECWGAAATPGHPHALPHFVFAPPQTEPSQVTSFGPDLTANEVVSLRALDSWCGSTQHGSGPHEANHEAPAGQSTPSLLGITLLAPLDLQASALVAGVSFTGFVRLLHPLFDRTVSPKLFTPPPRAYS